MGGRELLPETFRPVLVAGLVAVHQQVCEGFAEIIPDIFLQGTEDIVPVESGYFRIHLVGLEAFPDQFLRNRMREGHGARMTDPVNLPVARGSIPIQLPGIVHFPGQVKYIVAGQAIPDRDGHHRQVMEFGSLGHETAVKGE